MKTTPLLFSKSNGVREDNCLMVTCSCSDWTAGISRSTKSFYIQFNYFTMHTIGRHPNHMHYEEYALSHVTLCDFKVTSCSIPNIPVYPVTSPFVSRASTVLLCKYLQFYYKSQSKLGLFMYLHRYRFFKSKSYSVKWFQTT